MFALKLAAVINNLTKKLNSLSTYSINTNLTSANAKQLADVEAKNKQKITEASAKHTIKLVDANAKHTWPE